MQSKQFFQFLVLSFLMASMSFGCAVSKAVKQKQALVEAQKQVVVTKTGQDKRPDWTSDKPFKESDERFYFSGGVMNGADYALTIRLAKAEATKNLLESIQIKARAEFSNAIHGQNRKDNDLGRYVTDAVAWTVDNLRVNGICQREIYYEQIFDPMSQSFKYNTWVQLEISKADYLKAKVDAAQKMYDKAIKEKDQEAKEKALELLEKLRQEV
jgi:hypothetical protein